MLYELLRLQPSVVKCGFLSVNWQIIGKSYAALDDVNCAPNFSKNSAIAGTVVFCFIHAFHRKGNDPFSFFRVKKARRPLCGGDRVREVGFDHSDLGRNHKSNDMPLFATPANNVITSLAIRWCYLRDSASPQRTK